MSSTQDREQAGCRECGGKYLHRDDCGIFQNRPGGDSSYRLAKLIRNEGDDS